MINKKEMNELPHDFNLLISSDSQIKLLDAYKIIEDMHYPGVCVNLNKPVHNLIYNLKKNKINNKKMSYIDAISIKIKSDIRHENVTYVPDSKNLSDLGLTIEKQISKINGKKFLLFDSVHDLALLNGGKITLDFISFLDKRMKLYNTNCIFLVNDKIISKEMKNKVESFCDKSITL